MFKGYIAQLAAVVAALALGGCSDTSAPQAAPPTVNTGPELWDPCTIPDDAIRALDLKPETKDGANPKQLKNVRLCQWDSTWYQVSVHSTADRLDEIRNKPNSRNVTPVAVGPYDGLQYQYIAVNTHGFGCIVAVGNEAHTISTIYWNNNPKDDHGIDACATAMRAAVALNKYFRL